MATNIYGNGTTTATAGANTVVHYYDKAGVKAANEVNVYGQFADRRSMPLNMGKTFKVSKWLHIYDRPAGAAFDANGYLSSRDIADITTGLTATDGTGAGLLEGSGATNKVSIKKITMETAFNRYGEMVDYTDEAIMFSEDMIQVRYREELGRLANRRQEDLIQADMLSGTNVMYSGTATTTGTVGNSVDVAADGTTDNDARISYDLVRKASRVLVQNRAEKNTSIITGSTKVDTRTVNKAFYAIVGPEIKYDLESLTRGTGTTEEFAYIPAYKYASARTLVEGEIGAMHDVIFIESESAVVKRSAGATIPVSYAGSLSNDGTNFDVFPILIPTKGAFATVGLKGNGKIKFRSQSPDVVELGNPYGTNGFFSYNMWYAGIILQEEKLLRLEVCATN